MPKLYLVIEYGGPQDWIDKMIDIAIHGERDIGGRFVRAATIDPEDDISVICARDLVSNRLGYLYPPLKLSKEETSRLIDKMETVSFNCPELDDSIRDKLSHYIERIRDHERECEQSKAS